MAGATTTISFPASRKENFSTINDTTTSKENGQQTIFDEYVSPTFKSSPLFAPEATPKTYNQAQTSPILARAQTTVPSHSDQTAWGTHIHKYAGIGDLTFLGNRPKTRDLYVARSHRHYLSGLSYVRHDKITRKQITSLKRALNRDHDDLILPPNSIPPEMFSRMKEKCKFVKEDKYASHQNRTEMFPQRGKCKLSDMTEDAIRNLLNKRYGQTSYSECFYDQRAKTTLSLGPQFQFYETHPTVVDPTKSDQVELPQSDVENHTDDDASHTTSIPASASSSTTTLSGAYADDEVSDNDNDDEVPDAPEPPKKVEMATSTTNLGEGKPLWPSWPGNLANVIDPVTLKITEKRDVVCPLENFTDVRTLPVYHPKKIPDYKLKYPLDHAPTSDQKFAPAKIDFATSGIAANYGSKDARSGPDTVIQIEKAGNSRFKKLPAGVAENVERICRGDLLSKRPRMPGAKIGECADIKRIKFIPQPPTCGGPMKTRGTSARVVKQEPNDLEALQNTINEIQQPKGPNWESLPPLWETLSYSSNRVVDHLSVQFKSAAQKRYHDQHKENLDKHKIRLPHTAATAMDGRSLYSEFSTGLYTAYSTGRRQYYAGNHMGSSFR